MKKYKYIGCILIFLFCLYLSPYGKALAVQDINLGTVSSACKALGFGGNNVVSLLSAYGLKDTSNYIIIPEANTTNKFLIAVSNNTVIYQANFGSTKVLVFGNADNVSSYTYVFELTIKTDIMTPESFKFYSGYTCIFTKEISSSSTYQSTDMLPIYSSFDISYQGASYKKNTYNGTVAINTPVINFIDAAKTLNLKLDQSTVDAEWYQRIYQQGYVVIISSNKEKLYSVLSSPDKMICKKVNRLILSDYYTMSGKIRHRFPRSGDPEQVSYTYNCEGEYDKEYYPTTMNDTAEILYTSYDIYDDNGVLIKAKNMEVPKFEPVPEYKNNMLRLYDGNIIQNKGTEDTYILDWLYREMESDLYFTEYEISALSTVENYKKLTALRTYKDILLDGGYNGNMAQKSEYKFDLSNVAEKIAIKTWSDEKVSSVIPDAIYVRPIKMELYDNKVYQGDWLKVAFTYDGNKIIKAKITDVSDIKDNGDGTVTDTTATDSNEYTIDEVKEGLDSLDQYNENNSNKDILKTVNNTFGQLPSLIGTLFSFIPTECIVLISLAITFIVALMIKRAIL